MTNYDNPDGKYPSEKLTEAQVAFLQRLRGKSGSVFPGTETRVANGLVRARFITVTNDYATITELGREKLREHFQYDQDSPER